MIEPGKTYKLNIIKIDGDKLYCDAQNLGIVEVINNDLVLKYNEGDQTSVFLYYDNENKLCGFHGRPYAEAGEFARLKVVANTNIGSFLDWGMDKDLFCPFAEQKQTPEFGKYYIVYIYIDPLTMRTVASMKYEKYLSQEPVNVEEGQSVEALILNKSQLGYNAVVNNKFQGLFYDNEVFTNLKPGTKLNAIVHKVRDDNKLDLRLYKNDASDISEFESKILNYMQENKGRMNINDDSAPELIYKVFGISKKNFKKALGSLYKKEIIDLSKNTITFIKK
ncbi:MAG: S1-like domain-containing RNA-binding protein [Bacteroidales bacterium]|nr:S1-like domain-containing RNA-binding protein [Bacteroidales bacterium]